MLLDHYKIITGREKESNFFSRFFGKQKVHELKETNYYILAKIGWYQIKLMSGKFEDVADDLDDNKDPFEKILPSRFSGKIWIDYLSLIAAAGTKEKEQFETLNRKLAENKNKIHKLKPLVPLEKFIEGLDSYKCSSNESGKDCIGEQDFYQINAIVES